MLKKLLHRSQARLSLSVFGSDCNIIYGPRKSNGKVDVLMRRRGDLPDRWDERLINMELVVLEPENLPDQLGLLADVPPAQGHLPISYLLIEVTLIDALTGKILEGIWTIQKSNEVTIGQCREEKGPIRYTGKLYVRVNTTLRLRLIHDHHDTVLAAHHG